MNCNEAGEFMVSAREERSATQSRDFSNHVQSCPSCARTASISDIRRELIGTTHGRPVMVPPFFSAKVMAAIAERRAEAEAPMFEPWAWIWQMARRTVPAMLGLLVLVAALTFGYTPAAPTVAETSSDTPATLAGEIQGMLPQDGQSSIMFTSNADPSADSVLSTVLGAGGKVTNE